MKPSRFILGISLLLFLSFPFILLYSAFYSGSSSFKNSVNNDVELYYIIFTIAGIVFSAISTTFLIDKKKVNAGQKKYLLLLLKITIFVYALLLVFISASRFITFKSQGIDINFFRMELEQLASFTIPSYAWSQHFSPFLFVFVPFFWIARSGTLLVYLQAAAVVSGAIPLYLAAKEKLGSQFLGLALATAYLSFGGLQFGYAYGFHEIMFFPPLFLWAYYYFVKKRFKLYFLFILLCLTVKEEVSFIMIFWGLYLLYKKSYRYAFGTILLGSL